MSKTNEREKHPDFIKYQEYIVNHENYKGLYYSRNKDGSIGWVITGKSIDGKKRETWWISKCEELGLSGKGAFTKAAVLIHPTKIHTCQICGKNLRIEYVYPNLNLLKKINNLFGIEFLPFEKDIFEIIDHLGKKTENIKKILELFKAPQNIQNLSLLKEWLNENYIKVSSKSYFSPGVMGNPPDRFDGFHSDGNCCRSKSDKGRSKENLQRYGQDRRVYENWADGDWKQSDRLMSMFRKFNLSADHIGPISLGFCHRPKFHPLTKEENSAKNNRMSLNDINVLINDEKNGEQVISWHSKYIWDNLKNKINSDSDAIRLSSIMRINLHYVLIILSMIDEKGYREFLMQFLNLNYSDFDYQFTDFKEDGTFSSIIKTLKNGKNQKNNKERYIRIAFESLNYYKDKNNRKVKIWSNNIVDSKINNIFNLLKVSKFVEAKIELLETLKVLANELSQNF